MKKLVFVFILVFVMSAVLPACGTKNEISSAPSVSDDSDSEGSQNSLSKEMAYEGVYNYCQSMYDWSIAKDNPDIMYLEMGEETESEYQVIFRSYTGALVYFGVDKLSGITRLTEYVPNLEIKEEVETIDLYDYLESDVIR